MKRSTVLTAGLWTVLAVFLSLPAAADAPDQASDHEDALSCLHEYKALQQAYQEASAQLTVISTDRTGLSPFLLLKTVREGRSYSFWEHLNGEIRGYALRDDQGFDYNQGRQAADELNWHPTLIWDRLLSPKTEFKDYVCVFTGRARVLGHKVSLLRLAPQDGQRYGYLIAKDDDTALPVEITVLDPQGGPVSKLMAVDTKLNPSLHFPINEEFFDRFAAAQQHKQDHEQRTVWPELTVPRAFTLTAAGYMEHNGGERVDFQEFSDGLNSFRVYRAPQTSVLYPALNNGTITILRRKAQAQEYAVVGEVPLRLAEQVLAKIPAAR